MLKKLYKYDFKSIFKLWKIFAIIIFTASVLMGLFFGAIDVSTIDEYNHPLIYIIFTLTVLAFVFAMSAFIISPTILSIVRFCKNLFSDEGYLTFTLPVKKKDILNAKLKSALVLECLTIVVAFFSIFVCLVLSGIQHPEDVVHIIGDIFDSFVDKGVWSIIYLVEILLLIFAIITYMILLIYACITFACLITKKARVITAIGIYYGINSILGILWNLFAMSSFFGTSIIMQLYTASDVAIASILGIVIIFISIVCLLLYMLEYYFLDKKLNLT